MHATISSHRTSGFISAHKLTFCYHVGMLCQHNHDHHRATCSADVYSQGYLLHADHPAPRGAYEGLPCSGLRAPRPQARQRDVAAARESLDRHRLWLRCPHQKHCQARLQPGVCRARSDRSTPQRGPRHACSGRRPRTSVYHACPSLCLVQERTL